MPASTNFFPAFGDGSKALHTALDCMADNQTTNVTEQKLSASEQRYRELAGLCQGGIFLTVHGRITYANQAAVDLLGGSDADQVIGRPLHEFLPDDAVPAEPPEIKSLFIEVNEAARPVGHELHRLDGKVSSVEVVTTACRDGDEPGCLVIVQDMSGRGQFAEQLKTCDRYMRLIADTVPALIAYIDKDQRYRFVNAAYEIWFQRPREDIIGRTIGEVPGAVHADMRPYIARALCGERVGYEHIMHTRQGDRHVMAIYAPDTAADGTVRGYSSMVMDITERRRRERILREQEMQLRLITDAVPVLIAQCDKDYRLRFINKTYADRFGFRPEDMIGRRIPDIVGDEAFALSRRYADAALAGKPQEHEIRIALPGTGDRYMHMMYVPELDERGNVHGLIAAISDITRLRHTEEQLHRREQEFKTLVENSPDGISRIDRGMRHIYVNPAVEAATGLRAAECLGKTKTELGLPADVVHAWDSAADAAFKTGKEQRFDFAFAEGARTRYFSARVIPEADRDGRIESVLGITYDVTERTKMERENEVLLARERAARIQAETAARARDEFLAIVSHELRAPLNGIQSWAHILENFVKDSGSSPLAQRALNGIKTGVAQQVRLIEDLLDVTRMMSGKLRLVKQPFMLLPVIQAAVESVRDAAAAKHIGIKCTWQITDEQIDGDSDRMQQIIWNLLSNSIKFTPQDGNVWLTARSTGARIEVTVGDDGVGISREFLPHLFDRFSQEDTSSTRGHSGLGLGLFLVRHLIELHGGSVEADSPGEGKGTIFTVNLPLRTGRDKYMQAAQSDSADNAGPLPSLNGLRILLIDDQEEARESLALVLASAGANVFAAASAREVIDWLPMVEPDELPDVLVCDIAMPVEDGYSVLRKLRAWQNAKGLAPLQRMPALALTAFAQREDRIRALTAGFQMHMTKPAAPEELIIVIAMMASRE
ncbi:MAG: domain S-box protein [Herminiimonas sp.]|nr:domain S-box protein [Herminiimonas sp.]